MQMTRYLFAIAKFLLNQIKSNQLKSVLRFPLQKKLQLARATMEYMSFISDYTNAVGNVFTLGRRACQLRRRRANVDGAGIELMPRRDFMDHSGEQEIG